MSSNFIQTFLCNSSLNSILHRLSWLNVRRFKAIKENIEVILNAQNPYSGVDDPAIKMAKREGRFEYSTGEVYEGWWDLGRVRWTDNVSDPRSAITIFYRCKELAFGRIWDRFTRATSYWTSEKDKVSWNMRMAKSTKASSRVENRVRSNAILTWSLSHVLRFTSQPYDISLRWHWSIRYSKRWYLRWRLGVWYALRKGYDSSKHYAIMA